MKIADAINLPEWQMWLCLEDNLLLWSINRKVLYWNVITKLILINFRAIYVHIYGEINSGGLIIVDNVSVYKYEDTEANK